MKESRLAAKIIKTLVKDRIYYPGRLLVETITVIARCGLLLILYGYVFRLNNGTIHGTGFSAVAWSMFIYFSYLILNLRKIAIFVMEDVRSGDVEVLFSKPISYLFYRMWWQIGINLYPFAIIASVGSIVMYFVVGIPPTMTISIFIPTLILVAVLGTILCLLVYATVGLLAFWIESVKPVFWIIDKAVMILGGSYLPVALFPQLMYKIALYSPFGALNFVTHTVQDSWQVNWVTYAGIQVFWILVFVIIVSVLFAKAKKKVSVNGG